MRVMVVGGGVGGLTAAVALRIAGIDVAIFEQMDRVGATLVGGGVHLWPNAARALREIGLDQAVRERGAPFEVTEFCSSRGGTLATWRIKELARTLDLFDVGIARSELLALLHGAVDGAQVISGATLVEFAQGRDGVIARFADGREEHADVLVGADGLRSVVRSKLLGDAEPDYAGYVQWQTLAEGLEDAFPPGVERITFGPGTRTVMHHVSEGRLFWACVVYGPASASGATAGRKARLLDIFGHWPDPIPAALEATPEEPIVGLPIYDRKPVRAWGSGRVTLLGDAAHPMTTNTSQGCNLAIEDGVVLARMLADGGRVEQALRAYEARRIARTTPMVKNSRLISNMNVWRDPLRVTFRDRFYSFGVPRRGFSELRKAMREPLL